MAGPTMRAPLNMEEFSAMAFMRSVRSHGLGHEDLPRRDVEGVHHAQQQGDGDDVPDVDVASEGEQREDQRQHQRRGLGEDDQGVGPHAVRRDAAHGGQDEHRELAREGHDPQHGRMARQPVDQPGLGHRLHPGADEGDQLP